MAVTAPGWLVAILKLLCRAPAIGVVADGEYNGVGVIFDHGVEDFRSGVRSLQATSTERDVTCANQHRIRGK